MSDRIYPVEGVTFTPKAGGDVRENVTVLKETPIGWFVQLAPEVDSNVFLKGGWDVTFPESPFVFPTARGARIVRISDGDLFVIEENDVYSRFEKHDIRDLDPADFRLFRPEDETEEAGR